MFTSRRRAVALAASLAAATLLVACEQDAPGITESRATITLPPLSGEYPVGTTDLHLVDARQDPWFPADKRELMLTVTYPAERPGERAPWLSPGMASAVNKAAADPNFLGVPQDTVDWGGTKRHASVSVAVDRRDGGWPVVLFSPSHGMAREFGAVLADDLASRGYIVVSMSHTHEAFLTEFPGGRIVPGKTEGGEQFVADSLDTRVADTRFVLDQLTRLNSGENPDAERRTLPAGLTGALDLSAVGMFGHSLGGYTAGETMYYDDRIDAGVNLDGGLSVGKVGQVVQHGLDRPFMLVGADIVEPASGRTVSRHTHVNTDFDPSWNQFWSNQRGWKRDLYFAGAGHYSLSDLQVVLPQISGVLTTKEPLQQIGTIDPTRSLAAQHEYLTAFFDLHLKHRNTSLFDGNSPDHPDTKFID